MTNANAIRVLSESELRHRAPSIFATAPHDRVGVRYQFVPTINMVEALNDVGWFPVSAQENHTRLPDRWGFTRHVVRFCRQDDAVPMVGDSFPELVLMNSHDGTSSFQLHAGLFRIACANGMVVANKDMGQIRRRHTGDAVGQVIEGSYEIVTELPRIAGKVETFNQIELSPAEQEIYAESALELRWDRGKAPITPTVVNRSRREEDSRDTLWLTFQRVQENLIRGGQRGRASTGRRLTTRAVSSVDGNVKLNKALWQLTERMAELKGA